MNRFSWKHIALKLDVIGPENTLFASAFEHLSARNLHVGTVKGLIIIVMATTAVTINVFLTISVVSHLPVALMAATTTLATTREIRTFMMAHFWLSLVVRMLLFH